MNPPRIFLSYVNADRSWADQLSSLLAGAGISVWPGPASLSAGTDLQAQVREATHNATHLLVLVGAQTRLSKWVDREIELGTESRDDGPGAGLAGVILPSHEDFSRPYYDPENVPVRLHDLVQNEYAIIRKWSENPDEIRRWLEEADRRRRRYCPEPSLAAAAQIYHFTWDPAVDASRANPETL